MALRVRLRPVTVADLDVFEREFADESGAGPAQWFGHRSMHKLRQRHSETGLLDDNGGVLTVEADGDTVGRVEWFASSWGPPATSSCWTIAIGLRAESRGQGLGSEAQRALVEYLLQHTRTQRIQAYTDITNIAEQRALERAGFEREGVVRLGQWRQGSWHDQVLYSVIRGSD